DKGRAVAEKVYKNRVPEILVWKTHREKLDTYFIFKFLSNPTHDSYIIMSLVFSNKNHSLSLSLVGSAKNDSNPFSYVGRL
ncbi:hypothetical protein, partial [Virgibacillus sp. SK37]|uniref:hypothetical protein n=1 Tax=Virgibacillus sp. SK37 TaxID=403957 RepID=UPI001B3160F5